MSELTQEEVSKLIINIHLHTYCSTMLIRELKSFAMTMTLQSYATFNFIFWLEILD